MTKVITTINEEILSKNICFIPTMGAIHEGHLSLVDIGKKTNLKTLVSIFLNRRQFNNDDGSILEGSSRPGHFEGVLTVVNRLFDLVQPSHAVFGKKDAQQLFLIKDMINRFDLNIEIIEGEIFRDKNGLALSSRNKHLSTDAKLTASNIFKSLQNVANEINLGKSYKESVELGTNLINQNEIYLDYLEIVDEENFKYILKNNKIFLQLQFFGGRYKSNFRENYLEKDSSQIKQKNWINKCIEYSINTFGVIHL